MKFWSLLLVVFLLLAGSNAEAARRLGGGRSIGQQSSNVAQRQAAPAQGSVKPAAPAPAAPATAAPKRPWGAMLGGLAAGLGLAWLSHSLGLGAAMGQVLLFALLAMLVMLLVGWFARSRRAAQTPGAGRGVADAPFAFQGASAAGMPSSPAAYRPENVGNDASARPWERNSMFDSSAVASAAGGSLIGSALGGSQSWGIPAGFDTDGFVRAAKANFVTLQAAWDRADIPALRAMMTDAMLSEIRTELAEREISADGAERGTDVVMIEAQLLGIEDRGDDYLASVEFSGMIREQASAGASPFREVWNMSKPKSGATGWLVAGVQSLQ